MPNNRFLPAEWHEQDAILITWPHSQSAWHAQLEDVEQTYFDLVAKISHYEDLIIQTHPDIDPVTLVKQLIAMGADVSHCHFVTMPSNDTWARDHGPLTVMVDGVPTVLDFRFNGWGNKFPAELDNQLTGRMLKDGILNNGLDVPNVLEGGSIESDGQGTLMTTTACLLNPNRNGNVTRKEVEESLTSWFGCEQVLWLEHGHLEGDDTDAHIDTLARFAPKQTIVFQGCQDETDSHHTALQQMKAQMAGFKDINGQPYRLLELPFPKPRYAEDGHRLPATYANFLICNRQIIVPTYEDPADSLALAILEQAFPEHFVTGINALPLIEEHGSIHCITMQLPKGSVNFNGRFQRLPINH